MATIRHGESEVMLIPKAIARSKNLSPWAKEVYLFAASLREDEESSTEYIASSLEIDDLDVRAYMDELNKAGFTRFTVIRDEH